MRDTPIQAVYMFGQVDTALARPRRRYLVTRECRYLVCYALIAFSYLSGPPGPPRDFRLT